MPPSGRVRLALIWHLHQPEYREPAGGAFAMPWVRIHATRNYSAMAALAASHPTVRQTFNFSGVLLDQLAAVAAGAPEAMLDLARAPVSSLSEAERLFVVRHFFAVNWHNYVQIHPRYRELLDKRGYVGPDAVDPLVARRFSDQDLRDLVVLFHLGWLYDPPSGHPDHPLVDSLRRKERDYSEEDKSMLLQAGLRIAAATAGEYRALQDRGTIEIAASPFYHPIGPLLLDQSAAREARPETEIPEPGFDGTRDLGWQIGEALSLHRRTFGRTPAGMWPPEGGVSEAFVDACAGKGIRWLGMDSDVLRHSLRKAGVEPGPWDHARSWRRPTSAADMAIVVRDHFLSDLVGFIYSKWKPGEAAVDFVHRVKQAPRDGDSPALVSVILDGENPWESYPNWGRDFLHALYGRLASDPEIECVRVSDHLAEFPPRAELRAIQAGSWINHDFSVWIGHAEDRAAWRLVAEARRALLDAEASLPEREFALAWRHLMTVEGSDWTWWFGPEHFAENAGEFDRLFRAHLTRIYRILGTSAPADLDRPVRGDAREESLALPRDVLDVTVDGRVTSYFEWLPAGRYVPGRAGSAMHRVGSLVERIMFGAARGGRLAVRIDFARGIVGPSDVVLGLAGTASGEVVLLRGPGGAWHGRYEGPPELGVTGIEVAAGSVVECAMRVEGAPTAEGDWLLTVLVRERDGGRVLESWPETGSLRIRAEAAESTQDWVV